MRDLTVFSAGTDAGTAGTTSAADAHSYLKSIYNDPLQPTNVRMRAAAIAIEYERPRLAVTAVLPDDGRFAERLEKALARSGQVLELRAQAPLAAVAVRRR